MPGCRFIGLTAGGAGARPAKRSGRRRSAAEPVDLVLEAFDDRELPVLEAELSGNPFRGVVRRIDRCKDVPGERTGAPAPDQWGTTPAGRVEHLHTLATAIDDWRDRANGKPMPVNRIAHLDTVLRTDRDIHPAASDVIATAVDEWAHTQSIQLHPSRPAIPTPAPSIGIEIDL